MIVKVTKITSIRSPNKINVDIAKLLTGKRLKRAKAILVNTERATGCDPNATNFPFSPRSKDLKLGNMGFYIKSFYASSHGKSIVVDENLWSQMGHFPPIPSFLYHLFLIVFCDNAIIICLFYNISYVWVLSFYSRSVWGPDDVL